MYNIKALIVRNAKRFLRDRATVFFSIMSSLILIALYFLFIGKIYIDGLSSVLPFPSGGAAFTTYSQMMAGVLVINSMSLALGMFSGMAIDFETKRVDSFMIMPVKKTELLLSYLIGGIGVSFALNCITWVVSYTLIGVATGWWLTAGTFFATLGVLLICSLISSSIMLLITALVKSPTALGVINGIAGTFIGFVCGIYMPYSQLGKGTEAVGSVLPFTHLTAWLKNIVLTDAFTQLDITGQGRDICMSEMAGDGIGFLGMEAPLWATVLYSALFGVACLVVAGFILRGTGAQGAKTQGAEKIKGSPKGSSL